MLHGQAAQVICDMAWQGRAGHCTSCHVAFLTNRCSISDARLLFPLLVVASPGARKRQGRTVYDDPNQGHSVVETVDRNHLIMKLAMLAVEVYCLGTVQEDELKRVKWAISGS